MNEKALRDAWTIFKTGGYNGSIDDFVKLVSTNKNALTDAHKMFSSGGYNGSVDDFATLIGVKKKDETIPSTSKQSPEQSPSATDQIQKGTKPSASSTSVEPKGKSKYASVVTDDIPTFRGYPGKEQNEYRKTPDGQWQIKKVKSIAKPANTGNVSPTAMSGIVSQETVDYWEDINHPDRVRALDRQFGQADVENPEYEASIQDNYKQKQVLRKIDWTDFAKSESDVVSKLNESINSVPEYKGRFKIDEIAPGSDAIRITNTATGQYRDVNVGFTMVDKAKEVSKEVKGFIELSLRSFDHDSKLKELRDLQEELDYKELTNPSFANIDKVKRYNELKDEVSELDREKRKIASEDDALASAYYTRLGGKNIKTELESLRIESNKISEEVKSQAKWYNDAKDAYNNGRISQEEWDSKWAPEIEAYEQYVTDASNKIETNKNELVSKAYETEKYAAAYIANREREGSTLSGATKSFIRGAGTVVQFMTSDYSTDEFGKTLADRFADQFTPQLVTSEYLSSDERNAFQQVVFGLSQSIGAATAGFALTGGAGGSSIGTLSMYANSYADIRSEMESDAFKDVPEYQKVLFSGMYGATVGFFEKYGLTKAFSKTPAGKQAVGWVLNKVAKTVPKNATPEAIEAAIENSVKSAISNKIIQITKAGVVEGSTEMVQEGADMLYKSAFNELNGKELFDGGPKNISDVMSRLGKSFALGALGGTMMNSLTQAGDFVSKQGLTSNTFDNLDFATISTIVNDQQVMDMYKTHLNGRVANGEISKEEATRVMSGINQIQELTNKMPDDIKSESKLQAATLLEEKSRLEKEIEGKDKALVANKIDRINAINEELTNISKQDAVQEQTTSEVPLQSETETGGTMEEGKSEAKPQVVTEEGQKEINYATSEVERVKTLPVENEDGATMNLDGSKYEGGGLVVPLASKNMKASELTREAIDQFIEENSGSIGSDNVKVGIYKFPNSDQVSIDLNIVADPSMRDEALAIGKELGQESLFDLGTFENVKTGADGMNPKTLTTEEFLAIQDRLRKKPSYAASTPEVYAEKKKQHASDPRKLSVVKAAEKASRATPNTPIVLHETRGEYLDAIANKTGKTREEIDREESGAEATYGSYMTEDGEVHIDMTGADETTVYHEVFHDIFKRKGLDESSAKEMVSALKSVVKDKDMLSKMDKFAQQYSEGEQGEEFITELVATLASEAKTMDVNTLQKLINIINGIAEKLGVGPVLKQGASRQEVVDFINRMSTDLREGRKISDVYSSGVVSKINATSGVKNRKVKVGNHKLSLVKQSDIIDIESIINEAADSGKKIWFWVADQLGRGMYYDNVLNKEHFLDAGPSYPLDPENLNKGVVWATGMNKSTANRYINESDYIFIISGSPEKSKLFNKQVTGITRQRLEDNVKFETFKSNVKKSNPPKKIIDIINRNSSYDQLFAGNDRKEFMIQILDQQNKPNTDFHKLIKKYNAFIDVNELRDGFYADNDFKQNDIMIVLKPTSIGGKSKHSTYEYDILGEVVGVPDKVINAFDIMPDEIKSKIKDADRVRAKESQMIAPYGAGIRTVSSIKKRKALPETVSEKLTEDGNGNYVFHHYSSVKRDQIKPGSGQNIITSKEEASALSAVGGLAQFYPMDGQKESGTGDVLHTIKIPADRVYDFNTDPENFYDEAKSRFEKVRPGQAFSPNYQLVFITQVANDNGYDMTVAKWRNNELRAQTTLTLTPELENTQLKERSSEEYKVGDNIIVYGEEAKITAVNGDIVSFKGEKSSGEINTRRSPRSIRKKRKSGPEKKKSNTETQRKINKQTGVTKPVKKTTVNERTALRDQILLEARAAREAVKTGKEERAGLADLIRTELGKVKGKIPGAKISSIINKALKMNLSNPVIADRFANYIYKLANDAEYDNKLTQANKVRNSIKRKLKSKSFKQKNNVAMATAFKKIDPRNVEDIDTYMEMATKVDQSLSSSVLRGSDVIYKVQAEQGEVNAYVDEQIKAQDKLYMDMLELQYPELFESGYLNTNMSVSEAMTWVNSLKDGGSEKITDEQLEQIKEKLIADANTLSGYLESTMSKSADVITGSELTVDDKTKSDFKELIKTSKKNMSISDLLKYIDVMQNALINGEVGGVSAFAAEIRGASNANKMSEKFGSINTRVNIQSWIGSMTNVINTVLGGVNRGTEFMVASGINAIRTGKNIAMNLSNKIANQYESKFAKLKPNGQKFMSLYNATERGVYAFVSRNVTGSDIEMANEFKRRIDLVKQTLVLLESEIADERMSSRAGSLREAVEKLGILEGDITIDIIESRVDKINIDAVQYWIDKWAENYDELAHVSSSIYNRDLPADLNYNPDVYKRVMNVNTQDITEIINGMGSGAYGVYDTQSSSLTAANRPKKLPYSDVANSTFMYVDFEFDANVSRAFRDAMIDIKTAEGIRQWQGFSKSNGFAKLIPNNKNRTKLTESINRYILKSRGADRGEANDPAVRTINRVMNTVGKIGGSLMLGGFDQMPKQSLSMIGNTIVNSMMLNKNGFNIGGAIIYKDKKTGSIKTKSSNSLLFGFSKEFTEWMMENGVDIAFRGIESTGTIEEAARFEHSLGNLDKAMDNLGAVSEMYVKAFLVAPDAYVARSAFASYYKRYLIENGLTPTIDTTKPMDENAKAYAMNMVSKQQGESDADMHSKLYSSKQTGTKAVLRLIAPLSSFVINKKASILSDVSTIMSDATKDEKGTAYRSLVSTTAESAIFTYISIMWRYSVINAIASAITGYEDDEDDRSINRMVEEENKRRKSLKLQPMNEEEEKDFRRKEFSNLRTRRILGEFVTNSARDILPLGPIVDDWFLSSLDEYVIKNAQEKFRSKEIKDAIDSENVRRESNEKEKMDSVEEEEFVSKWLEDKAMRLSIFDSKGYGGYDFLGEKLGQLAKIQSASNNGYIEEDAGAGRSKKIWLLPTEKKAMDNLSLTVSVAPLAPSDLMKVSGKAFSMLKKKGVTYDQYKRYSEIKKMYDTEPEGLEDMTRAGMTDKQIRTEVFLKTGIKAKIKAGN